MYTAAGVLDKENTIRRFAPMVKRIAHHLAARLPASVQLDDLLQAGLIGLMDAAGRFEESHGVQFETFATQRVRGAMLDELRASDWLPRGVRKAQRQIETALSRLEQRLGRAASESEVAGEMGVSLREYQQMLDDSHGGQLIYYDDSDRELDDDLLERNCPDEGHQPPEAFHDARFRKALIAAIDNLPEREKLLMGMYYEQELNFREIAAVLGVTESRVCQLHSQAVSRLRGKLKEW
ncbi:MAG TPA: RNA polymerase sigma factor FliA [Burkholderiales bacterium]|jgi:RNA polymerase sigma factor FliA|nr:RNA polymerase sigma factor FliA [Burkholderiales bacterium]